MHIIYSLQHSKCRHSVVPTHALSCTTNSLSTLATKVARNGNIVAENGDNLSKVHEY